MVQIHYIFYAVYLIAIVFIYRYEFTKYKKNTPYNPAKKKNNLINRFFLGILGGIHYSHFIGTYSHKKYNTQVFTPETFECYVAGSVAGLFLIGYPIVAWYLSQVIGIIGFSIMLIPIILNLISISKDKKN
ncbi:hypothetical protein COT60_03195 [Candidatus Pacearchaeota archaeon CG09_land_8_20_14_0_10_30_9]|nr:MAG: hypothetical protein AUJ61_00185 [Candidatus Pacearchaeota archaeon CG1_02_30_18]PIN71439.1 MAG: hypothetical protein COV77_01945 [Candidatus Pacearchaeota archaeon CG11_big_fil_rev_8_21_14_0_20_30_13]PIO00914.1 MAG: hypothetical protein COT60_03195 [Candidatus Pacearchaeota archaeon CG09_land_8_20_14_0_10_30_9]PJA71208.1 MAG: hypothetical protein CO153_02745 [Candidatus Pacearchaeota archaeon CG_4_9_14_3_um_filter_30_11]